MSTPKNDRATFGPFDMEGVEWIQYGHKGLVRSLEAARAAAAKLEELGFTFTHSEEIGDSGTFYGFSFTGDYSRGSSHFSVVQIIVIAVEYGERPPYEIVYYPIVKGRADHSHALRYGVRTYPGREQIDGLALQGACDKYGKDNVFARITLSPYYP